MRIRGRSGDLPRGILARYATGEFVKSGFAALPGLAGGYLRGASSASALDASGCHRPRYAAQRSWPGRKFQWHLDRGETTSLAFGTTTLALILAATGYIESSASEQVTQSSTAVVGITLSSSVVPAALTVPSLFALARYSFRRVDVDLGGPYPSVLPGTPPPA